MADMKKVCNDLIIINLYCGDLSRQFLTGTCIDPKNLKLHICWHFFEIAGGRTVCASYLLAVHTSYILGTIERKLIKKIRTLEKWLQYRPLPNSFPTNYILINSSIVLSYWAYVHCKCLQGITGTLRGNQSAGISNLWGLHVYPQSL